MTQPLHEFPEQIVLEREEYRLLHGALEAALDVLDRIAIDDTAQAARQHLEAALHLLLRRIWPYLEELDDE